MAARLIPPAGDGPLSGAAGGQGDRCVAWPASPNHATGVTLPAGFAAETPLQYVK